MAGKHALIAGEAFSEFYSRHADAVLVFIVRRVYDTDVALDLTAETFAQAFIGRRRFRGTTLAEAQGWIYAIARGRIADYVRRGKAEKRALRKLGITVPALTDDDLERVDELAGLAELRAAIADGLAQLSPENRDALALRVVHELSYQEVAASLAISEQTARARVSRGLRTLARTLEARHIAKEIST
jgi:RNA polymerase sigma-70 factor (ECF subfamily)